MEFPRGQDLPDYDLSEVPLKPIFNATTTRYDLRDRYKRRRWHFRQYTSQFWLWELSSCTLSLVLVGIMIFQLKRIDGKPTVEWDWPWEPSSVLAFSVTVMKAAIMIAVASSLGQLKWHWFKETHQLDYMEHFDEASRGALGSAHLLMRLKLWNLASVGAIITICSLMVDTLAQNAVEIQHYPIVENDSAIILVTDRYNYTAVFPQKGNLLPPAEILSTINYAFISRLTSYSIQERLVYCNASAERCEFPAYQSLAVGAQCIKREVKINGSVARHSALDDSSAFKLDLRKDLVNSTTSLEYPTSGFSRLGPLIARWMILANPNTTTISPVAMDCTFHWTVNTYVGLVSNGTLSENTTDTWTNTTDRVTSPHDIILKPPKCLPQNTPKEFMGMVEPESIEPRSNRVFAESHRSLQAYFSDPGEGIIGWASNVTHPEDREPSFERSSIVMESLLFSLVNMNPEEIVDVLNETAHNLAYALTFSVRTAPRAITGDLEYKNVGTYRGIAYHPPHVRYHIRWRYVAVPIAFVTISALFFVVTVVHTWRETKWKTSSLAVLLHGLSKKDLEGIRDVDEYADMRAVGKSLKMRLATTEEGRKLVSKHVLL